MALYHTRVPWPYQENLHGFVIDAQSLQRQCRDYWFKCGVVGLVGWQKTVNQIDRSHGRVAASETPWAPHVRNSTPHPENEFEGSRSHNPTKLLCALVQKQYVLEKLLHWLKVPHMRNSIAQGRLNAGITTDIVGWLDPGIKKTAVFSELQISRHTSLVREEGYFDPDVKNFG